jgi:hypothetical protein
MPIVVQVVSPEHYVTWYSGKLFDAWLGILNLQPTLNTNYEVKKLPGLLNSVSI